MCESFKLNTFELAVLEKLLEGKGRIFKELWRQIPVCKVTKRQHTGHGFYTDLLICNPEKYACYEKRRFQVGDVMAKVPSVNVGLGFILFVENGCIKVLECFSYSDDPCPKTISEFNLEFIEYQNSGGNLFTKDRLYADFEI